MDPFVIFWSVISSLVIVTVIYKLVANFRASTTVLINHSDTSTQTEHSAITFSDQGISTRVKTENRKQQAKPQVYNAATETEELILDTEEIYADFTLFGELLQYNLGTDYQTLKETYDLAIHTFTDKTSFIFKQQQRQIEHLEDNIRDEVRAHTQFLL